MIIVFHSTILDIYLCFLGRVLKLPMEELLAFFQNTLPESFIYDDDHVVDSLHSCMEELVKTKLSVPPPNDPDVEVPQKPFGLFVPQSVEQIIGRRTMESEAEIINNHKRMSIREARPSIPADGGPAYLPYSLALNNSMGECSSNLGSLSVSANGTDPYDSRQSITDYNSTRTSFPGSEATSLMSNNSTGVASATSILSAINHNKLVSQTAVLDHVGDVFTMGKVDSIYEQTLEHTFGEMEGIHYHKGVTIVNVTRASSEPPNVAYSNTTTPRASQNASPLATPAGTPNIALDNRIGTLQTTAGTVETLLQTSTFSVTGTQMSGPEEINTRVSPDKQSMRNPTALLTNAALELHNQQLANHTVHQYDGHTPSSGNPTPIQSPRDPVDALFGRAFPTDNNYKSCSNVSPAQRPITMKIQPVNQVDKPTQQQSHNHRHYPVKTPNGNYVYVAPSVRRHTPSSPTRLATENSFPNHTPAYKIEAGHVSPVNQQMSPVNHYQQSSPVKVYTPPSVYKSPTRHRNIGHISAHTSPRLPGVWSEEVIIPAEYSASMHTPLPHLSRQSPTKPHPQTSHTQVVYL